MLIFLNLLLPYSASNDLEICHATLNGKGDLAHYHQHIL